jgi:photosystem II stability/assembly factor-like uncharacterized protein
MNVPKTSAFCLAFLLLAGASQAQWVKDSPRGSEDEPQNDHPEAADAWYWGQRSSGHGYIPADGIQNALVQSQILRNHAHQSKQSPSAGRSPIAQATNVQWTQIGPSNIGGRINALAVHPTDPKTVYIGAANGGVWKTMDAGQHWAPLTDYSQSLAMGAIAIDPHDPNTIFAGTGELPKAIDTYSGYGILVSHDAGASWMTTGPINVGAYSRIIVDPANSQIVYAAAGRSGGGVFRSTDGGKTWPRLDGGLPHGQVTDLALSMNGDQAVLYAGVAALGVFRSMDGGDSWTKINEFATMYRMQLDASATDWQRVAVISVHSDGTLEGFQGSMDGGSSWNSMVGNLSTSLFQRGNGDAQGWYDVLLRIDPSNPDHVIVGGLSLFSSDNFGNNWVDNGHAYAGGVHPDQHAVEFAPSDPSILYAGNDGGFYSSSDGGSTYFENPGALAITQFYVISSDQSVPDVTYGGTQDNGTLTGTATDSWSSLLGGDGGYVICDPKNPDRLYVTTPNDPYPAMLDGGVYTDIGSTLSNYGDSTTWLNPLLLDSKNDILYYGSDHLSQSTNHGSSWSHGQTRVPDLTYIQAIAAFGDKRNVLAGTSGGHLYLTTDKGRRWKDITSNLPGRWITGILYGESDTNEIYVTLSGFGGGHIFHTSTAGSSWQDISGDLPDLPVTTIVRDPQNANVFYIGSDIGVFLTPDNGKTWLPYGAGLPNVAVTSLEIHQSERVLRAGTHGRSIWEAPLMVDLPGITTPTQRSVWVMGDSAMIRWHGLNSPVTISLSQDGGASWTTIQSGFTGTSYPIHEVRYSASQNALVKLNDGTQELTSPLFEIVQRKSGETLKVLSELPYTLYDVAWDPDENVLWGTNWSDFATLYKIDPDNGHVLDSVRLPAEMKDLTGIKYDRERKHFFVHQAITDFNSNWYEITKTGTIVQKGRSQSAYGTGIYFKNDTLFLADRLTSGINRVLESDSNFVFTPLSFERTCLYGPRCLAYNAKLDRFMLAYTDFVGTNSTNARLTGSYVLYLNPYDGTETDAYYMQLGGDDINIRGMEWDPRNGGNTAWVTYLESGSSAKLVKITLEDGPTFSPGNRVLPTQLAGAELGQNFPNPFNPSTSIPFITPLDGVVQLRIVDDLGRVVLESSAFETAGRHKRRIDCSTLTSGSYTYELRVNGLSVASRRMTLMK